MLRTGYPGTMGTSLGPMGASLGPMSTTRGNPNILGGTTVRRSGAPTTMTDRRQGTCITGPGIPIVHQQFTPTARALGVQSRPRLRPTAEQASPIPQRQTSCKMPMTLADAPSVPCCWSGWLQASRTNPILGNGAFAKIYGVEERRIGGESFAVKLMSRHEFAVRGIESQIESEIAAMRRCAEVPWCTNVVKLLDTAEENGIVYLLLELCHYDLLRHMGMQPSGRLTEADARRWTRQLLLGLRDLHSFGIVHRDVKPENLLCARDGKLKIADFGWCCNLDLEQKSMAGTFQYMSPEMFKGEEQTEGTDIWSTGMTLYQLLTGKNLLNVNIGPGITGLSQTDPHAATDARKKIMLEEIKKCCPPKDQDRPGSEDGATWTISPLCWDLLQRMLEPDPALRIPVSKALQHPWFPKSMVQDAPKSNLGEAVAKAKQPRPRRMTSPAEVQSSVDKDAPEKHSLGSSTTEEGAVSQTLTSPSVSSSDGDSADTKYPDDGAYWPKDMNALWQPAVASTRQSSSARRSTSGSASRRPRSASTSVRCSDTQSELRQCEIGLHRMVTMLDNHNMSEASIGLGAARRGQSCSPTYPGVELRDFTAQLRDCYWRFKQANPTDSPRARATPQISPETAAPGTALNADQLSRTASSPPAPGGTLGCENHSPNSQPGQPKGSDVVIRMFTMRPWCASVSAATTTSAAATSKDHINRSPVSGPTTTSKAPAHMQQAPPLQLAPLHAIDRSPRAYVTLGGAASGSRGFDSRAPLVPLRTGNRATPPPTPVSPEQFRDVHRSTTARRDQPKPQW